MPRLAVDADIVNGLLHRAFLDLQAWDGCWDDPGRKCYRSNLERAKFQLEWILSEERTGGGTFVDCCEAQSADADDIRRGILAKLNPSAVIELFVHLHRELDELTAQALADIEAIKESPLWREHERKKKRRRTRRKPQPVAACALDGQRTLF